MNIEEKQKAIWKAYIFVKHIEEHLKEWTDNEMMVMCKICNMTIDEIWEEHIEAMKDE